MDATDIKILLEMGERITLECKRAGERLPKSVWETYSSFANKEEQFVLAIAATEESISNYRVQQLLGKNPLEAGKILYSLVGKGMLVSTNKGRWTLYSIRSEHSQGVKSRSKSQGVKSRSKSQGVKSREQRRQDVTELLVAYCREPRTLQEIALYLGFSDRYRMKRVYIDPILGRELEMTFAGSRNSPMQRYVAIVK